jgi:polyisoprenoid-binding protein YceI
MKKILLLSIVFAFACTNNTETDKTTTEVDYTAYGDSTLISHVKINPEESTVKWIGSKITESHEGTVNIHQGMLNIIDGKLDGGEFVLDMNTIKNTDIESEKYKSMLEEHLKDEDFFDVKNHPLSVIKITDAVKKGRGVSYAITADLTIKGITHPINFDADVKIEDLNYLATAKIKIDRTKWGVEYNSDNFFKDLGDRLIKDEVEFDIILRSEK